MTARRLEQAAAVSLGIAIAIVLVMLASTHSDAFAASKLTSEKNAGHAIRQHAVVAIPGSSEAQKTGKLRYLEGHYGAEWPEATMSSKAVANSEDWKQRYGVEPTGLTCHASADQSTMAGSFGCYSLDASGLPQWQVSTTSFVAASPEVFDVVGSVVSMREAGLYVVADGHIWPLDSLAAKVVPSKTPIDEAMPLIDAELAKYDQFPWLNVVVPLAVALALGGGAIALLVVASRRRRAAAATE